MHLSTISAAVCLLGLFHSSVAPAASGPAGGLAGESPPSGRYVEARTASVYAGACHYGSEYTTSGRQALLVWHFESGTWHGIDLAGADVALAVASEENLDAGTGARRSIVYADARCPEERREAAVDLVLTRCKALAGTVRGVELTELSVSFDAESYAAMAPGAFELRGSKLANRECCKMPYNVWYSPFAPVIDPIVGCDSVFRFEDRVLGPVWNRARQNESFVGRFEWKDELGARAADAASMIPRIAANASASTSVVSANAASTGPSAARRDATGSVAAH
jgi:hypothetical protein